MNTEKSKIQLGIDYIAKHPGCRTDVIAVAMGCERKNVIPNLNEAIKYGLIVSCKVEVSGTPPVNEFRLSASAPDGKAPDWKTWKKHNTAPERAAATTQAHRGANNGSSGGSVTSQDNTFTGAAIAVEPPRPALQQAAAGSGVISIPPDADLNLQIDSDGRLTIAQGDMEIQLRFKHTREIGRFMAATAGVWN